MHHRLFVPTALAAALVHSFPALASDAAPDEAAVVVTATRIPTRVNEQLADVTVITREDIERAGATTLPALLAQQPGLQIVTNGGIGKSTSLFTRGTNAGHTLLLVDGVPLGSATLGQPSFHHLPLAQIERIEILRGPASSLYGSDAIGGVVQIFTRKGAGPMKPEAFAGYGRYGTHELMAGISGGTDTFSYSLAAGRFETDGWDATLPKNTSYPERDADGYRNTSFRGRLAVTPAAGHEFGATFMQIDSRNRYDAFLSTANPYNDDETGVWSIYARNRLAKAWTSTLRYGESKDRSENFAPARSLFATKQKQWTWQNDVALPLGTLLLAYEDLKQEVDSTTAYTVRERTVESLVAGWQGRLGNHAWQLSGRRDDNSQFGAKNTGTLAYGYAITAQLTARAAYGTAFKAPSFNQLYYPDSGFGGGNPNLQPETAKNREIGLDWFGATGAHLRYTHYDNRINNLIAGWPPVNIDRARIRGDSFEGGHRWGVWSAQVALDVLRPINEANGYRLPRRAAQQAKARVGYDTGAWGVGAEVVAVGKRYDTTTQTREMPRYELVNLAGHYALTKDLRLEARLDNLFDKDYETAWGYRNPGRMLFVGVRYQ